MSNVELKRVTDLRGRNYYLATDEEVRQFNERSGQMERELNKAASAGLFLTAADLQDE